MRRYIRLGGSCKPIVASCAPVRLRPRGCLPWSDSRGGAGGAAQVEAESQLPEVLMTYVHTMGRMAQWFALADADVALYAAKVTVWGRWIVWFFAAVLLAYRPGLWYPEDIGYALLNVWGGPTGGLRRAGPRLQRDGAGSGANGRPACRGNGRPGRGDDHRLRGPP